MFMGTTNLQRYYFLWVGKESISFNKTLKQKIMKKNKLLKEYNIMKISNSQEVVGGLQKLVPYDTFYTSKKSTYSPSGVWSLDTVEDCDTDYYEDTVVTDPPVK